jgi:hypothetical protein
MASPRIGAVALASACLAGSLAWSGVPAIASTSQAAPATTTTANETLDDEAGTDGDGAESSTPVPESSPSPSPSPSLSPSPSPGSSPDSTPESPDASEDPETSETSAESPSQSPSPTNSPLTSNDDVDDYIVVVRNAAYIDSIKSKAEDLGGESDKELRGAVDGFTAALTPLDVNELRADPNVRYIEPDALIELHSATFRTVTKTTTSNLSSCDDCSSPSLSLGFTLDWFGTQYTNIFVNTNGGAVLDDGLGSFRSYRNFDLRTATRPYILPLFTDLNPAANGTVEFGRGTISDGSTKNVFWAEWIDVAEYGNNSARQEFQMLIIEESDGATIEFRYVDLTNAGSTTNSVFEVGFADPTDSNNTVRIPDSNGDPSASELLSGKSGGSTGIWAYSVADSGSPSPAPTPTPTPTPINTIQPNPPWGLDRIDQRSLPLDNGFAAAGNGSGVTVYVIDTGIRTTHTEYASRVVAGYDFVDDDSNPSAGRSGNRPAKPREHPAAPPGTRPTSRRQARGRTALPATSAGGRRAKTTEHSSGGVLADDAPTGYNTRGAEAPRVTFPPTLSSRTATRTRPARDGKCTAAPPQSPPPGTRQGLPRPPPSNDAHSGAAAESRRGTPAAIGNRIGRPRSPRKRHLSINALVAVDGGVKDSRERIGVVQHPTQKVIGHP